MVYDGLNFDLRDTIAYVEARLPRHVREALETVPVVEVKGLRKLADAGIDDIRIAPLPCRSTAADAAIVAHEAAHVYLKHYARMDAGAITREAAEREADAQVVAWGLAGELASRHLFYGR